MPFPCTCSSPEFHAHSAGGAGRRLHVIDIENLLSGGMLSTPRLRAWSDAYAALDVYRCGDHVTVGVDVTGFAEVKLALGSPRVVAGRGRDGADRALLAVLRDEIDPAQHYAEVVLASGDGIFAGEVARLRDRGLPVTVVARPPNLSNRLRLAAGGRTIPFPCTVLASSPSDEPTGVAA